MIKRMQRLLNTVNRILDAILLILALQLANFLWLTLIKQESTNIATALIGNLPATLCYALVMVLVYQLLGLYGSQRLRRFGSEFVRVCAANALGVLIVAAMLFLFRLEDFSRGVLGLFWLFSCVLVLVKRAVVRRVLRYYRKQGYNQKHVILVGDGPLAVQYAASVKNNPEFGYNISGYVGASDALEGLRCFGGEDKLKDLLENPGVDEVVAAIEAEDSAVLPTLIELTDRAGVKLSIIPFYNNYIPSCNTFEVVGESKLINVRSTPLDDPFHAMVKRAFDIVGSLCLIILSSPLMLIALIGTRLSSPGPIIFRQERVGLNRKNFMMYKFRSMRVNTEEATGWTTDNDPRKTKFGSFMRKTSIDELPQFFNVLKGDMSLIGPRPEVPHYVEQFRETIPLYMVKHRVRPGITGWAQVKGFRGDTSIEGRIKCDIWYIENWSLSLDIRILFLTAFGGMINKEKLK